MYLLELGIGFGNCHYLEVTSKRCFDLVPESVRLELNSCQGVGSLRHHHCCFVEVVGFEVVPLALQLLQHLEASS